MRTQEVLARLREARDVFDAKVAAVPAVALEEAISGSVHSVKDIVAHVTAYDELIVERLVSARHGAMTAFDRDRVGWEAFNERTWADAGSRDAKAVLAHAREVFAGLLREVGRLSDEEIGVPAGATAALDPAWLDGRQVWELIGIDAFDHYPMHYAALDAAAAASR